MGTIKADTVTGLADPNKVSLSSGATLQVDKIVNVSGDKDSGIDLSTNDEVKVNIADSQAVKVTSTQTDIKVSASRELNILKDSSDDALVIQSSAPDASNNLRRIELVGEIVSMGTGASSGTSNTERMRVDVNGNMLIGKTATGTENTGCQFEPTGTVVSSRSGDICQVLDRRTNAGEIVSIRQGGTAVGGIDANSSSVDFNTSSDYRLKENVTTSWDATTRLKQLKPSRFSWKVDGKSEADTDGFLAHEVSSVVPQATKGTKDEVVTQKGIDEGTYPKDAKVGDAYMQSIDHSKLVPLLVKTIQELEARIATLESK